MRVLSISQLLQLTRIEITQVAENLTRQLAWLAEGSVERRETLATLENIRIVLARPEFRPRAYAAARPAP